MKVSKTNRQLVIYFDNQCTLCQHAVLFLTKYATSATFEFTPLCSEKARRELSKLLPQYDKLDSVVLRDGNAVYWYSDALIALAPLLKFPFKLLKYTSICPKPLRDSVYKFVARHRKMTCATHL